MYPATHAKCHNHDHAKRMLLHIVCLLCLKPPPNISVDGISRLLSPLLYANVQDVSTLIAVPARMYIRLVLSILPKSK
jgi:hypothetical protein